MSDNVSLKNIYKDSAYTFLLGSSSSAITTILFQPLDHLKTRLQIRTNQSQKRASIVSIYRNIILQNGFLQLWRGTGISLIRAVPGVGFYYSSLHLLQSNFSNCDGKPNNSYQAFLFALSSRTLVSLIFMPLTVTKVHYESGKVTRSSIISSIKYIIASKQGWVGISPTILRDSLFSGIYYVCYTRMKDHQIKSGSDSRLKINLMSGLISGIIASIVTNPLDVIKTRIQNNQGQFNFVEFRLAHLFSGLIPRSLKRTLVAASTWALYEYLKA